MRTKMGNINNMVSTIWENSRPHSLLAATQNRKESMSKAEIQMEESLKVSFGFFLQI